MNILCVDDDRTTLTLVTRSLEKVCPEDTVLGVGSGEEAIETIKSTPVDLIITDLVMPGAGGIDVLEAAKKVRTDTEIIMVTAYSSVESAVEAMQKGARDYLPKPINIDLLVEKVENLREFLLSRQEVSDYRYAMSIIEEDVSRTAKESERRLASLQRRLDRIGEVLESPIEATTKLDMIRKSLGEPQETKV